MEEARVLQPAEGVGLDPPGLVRLDGALAEQGDEILSRPGDVIGGEGAIGRGACPAAR
jgi:hypothetical protein